MKRLATLLLLTFVSCSVFAQQKVYDDKLDAMQQIREAVAQAKQTNRYVLCQVGGNWCPWCLRFAAFASSNEKVHQLIENNFVYIHVNYSKENKNPEAMRYLGNPARFGFPVFVILDENGKLLHIQESGVLEEDKSYSEKKVVAFLSNWTRSAVETLK
ncbi:MAG: thioredoxin family protein [Bacteroidales bacterium]|nr:thioredoxin family protein [Bacteroidales bacterium]